MLGEIYILGLACA